MFWLPRKRNNLLALLALVLLPCLSQAQIADSATLKYKGTLLLTDPTVQLQSAHGLNALYDFDFFKAEAEFKWFKRQHPDHPMPYFLLGLSYWWQMMPEPDITKYDGKFLAYMDTSIAMAERLLKREHDNPEGYFFLAAAHGFQGRLYAERKSWVRGATSGKAAMSAMQKGRRSSAYGIEFLFGEALYNYYREWIPDNYKVLKPVMSVFPRGDKAKGMKQLEEVTRNAFYTRTEGLYFLIRIYGNEEGNPAKAYPMAKLAHRDFPNNPYFTRTFARYAYATGQEAEVKEACQVLMKGIEEKRPGYGPISGRYATFYLGHYAYAEHRYDEAKTYLLQTKAFGEEIEAEESGYYLWAVAYLARMAKEEGDKEKAREYYQIIADNTERKNHLRGEAKTWLKENKEKKRFLFF